MQTATTNLGVGQVGVLLRGESQPIQSWLAQPRGERLALHIAMIFVGAGAFGAAIGWWRAPQQALYTAIKLPLIMLLTAMGNGLLNGMLAPLLGLNITFRQSLLAVVMSFSIAAAILGAFAPLIGFLIWNVPPLASQTKISDDIYSVILLVNVAVIALAGITANLRLLQLLRQMGGGSRAKAVRVLFAWLAGNLFLGAQLSWILRPFIGSPGLPTAFLRPDAFHGNFYETVFHVARRLFTD